MLRSRVVLRSDLDTARDRPRVSRPQQLLGGRVSDWLGGTLATVPGGCDFRLAFNPWADAPDEARDKVSGDKEFLSTDPNMRASKPTVSEIIILYPQ